jgi:hypothetical protein
MSVPIVYVKSGCAFCEVLLEIIQHVDAAKPENNIQSWAVHDTSPYPPHVKVVPSIYDPNSRKLYASVQPCTRFVLSHIIPSAGGSSTVSMQSPRTRQDMGAGLSTRSAPVPTISTNPQSSYSYGYEQAGPSGQSAAPSRMMGSMRPSMTQPLPIDTSATLDNIKDTSRDIPDDLFGTQILDRSSFRAN